MKKLFFLFAISLTAFSWTAYQNNPSGMLDNPAYLGWINEMKPISGFARERT
jgi:hypothetical protein